MKAKTKGGRRRNSGRKAGQVTQLDKKIQKYCNAFIMELLRDDAIKQMTIESIIENEIKLDPCVYIIKNKITQEYKIGYTANWKARFSSYKTHGVNFVPVVQVFTKKARDLEASVHNLINKDRVKREWYKLKDETIIQVLTYLTNNK